MKGNLNGYIRDYGGKMGIAVSEYGHGASAGMHENPAKRPSPTGFWHPEEWQSHAHEINYRCIREKPEVWGAFVWNMFDFGSSSRFEGESPGINDKGLVTYDRKTPKDAYFFYSIHHIPQVCGTYGKNGAREGLQQWFRGEAERQREARWECQTG